MRLAVGGFSRERLVALGVARVATRGGPVKKQRDLDLRLSSAGNDTNVKTPAYILSLRCLGQVYRYFSELWMIIPCIYMTRYFHNIVRCHTFYGIVVQSV